MMRTGWRDLDRILRGEATRDASLRRGTIEVSIGGLATVPLLLLATLALSLPSYFVLSTLLGLRGDFAVALRAVIASQAALAVILAVLAPLVLL